jgi:F-type H+-transporting ATPase subunit gamma
MKIVASTKLTRAQRAMTESRAYGQTSNTVFEEAETKPIEGENKKTLLVICSSDKGLCGGIHSGLTRATRRLMTEQPGDYDLVILGEKCKAQLGRSNAKNVVLSFAGVGKDVPTFADAQAIADQITLLPTDYASIKIMYNKFLNAQSYEPTTVEAFSEEAIAASRKFSPWNIYHHRNFAVLMRLRSQLHRLRNRRRGPGQPARVRSGQQPLLGSG